MKVDYKDFNERAAHLCKRYQVTGSSDEDAKSNSILNATVPVAPRHSGDFWITPNALLRCSLFRVAQPRAERKHFHRHRLPLQGSRQGHVEYTGEELRQSDGDVFMSLLRAEQKTPGLAVIRPRLLATELGWGTSTGAEQRVENSIIRMSATNVEVSLHYLLTKKSCKIAFSLVAGYSLAPTGEWLVYLDERLHSVRPELYTYIQNSHLSQLTSGAVLASWLLKYLSSHREPAPITFEDLRRFCGASSVPKEFSRLVNLAAKQLQKIGFLESFTVDDGMLKVVRIPFEFGVNHDEDGDVDTPKNAADTPKVAADTLNNAADTPKVAADTPKGAADTLDFAAHTPRHSKKREKASGNIGLSI